MKNDLFLVTVSSCKYKVGQTFFFMGFSLFSSMHLFVHRYIYIYKTVYQFFVYYFFLENYDIFIWIYICVFNVTNLMYQISELLPPPPFLTCLYFSFRCTIHVFQLALTYLFFLFDVRYMCFD